MIPLSPPRPHTLAMGAACGLTDTGTVRPSNQDNLLIDTRLGLVAVADGMGGHAGGALASTEALLLLARELANVHDHPVDPDTTWTGASPRAVQAARDAVLHVNATLYGMNAAAGLADGIGMGTTLSALWQPEPGAPAIALHVGDSRIYRWRDGLLEQLTHDHTLYQQALEQGLPEPLPPRNLLLQALGPSPDIEPDVFAMPLQPGDLYLLCSDGLYGEAQAGAIEAILAHTTLDGLEAACAALTEMAKQDGSRDNITALLLACPA
ncbi:PP2C family protein-serine/threonine phosphatase [Pseudoduganella sp. RAF53_2]|uniref:PP2C family protein-serine/threonine phosphatase n=1 Tax=unclassified Pseudoduganella TaxID=2637179 RepID=UPI003F9E7B52